MLRTPMNIYHYIVKRNIIRVDLFLFSAYWNCEKLLLGMLLRGTYAEQFASFLTLFFNVNGISNFNIYLNVLKI